MQSASEQWFDEAYYQRFYFDKKTSVIDVEHSKRLGAFVCSYLAYLRVPVARVLDIGCGIGMWKEAVEFVVESQELIVMPGSQCLLLRDELA